MQHPDSLIGIVPPSSGLNDSSSTNSSVNCCSQVDHYDLIIQNLRDEVQSLRTQLSHFQIKSAPAEQEIASFKKKSAQAEQEIASLGPALSGQQTRRFVELPKPPQFFGDRSKFRIWFCQVENYLRMYAGLFTSDTMRFGLFTSLMVDSAIACLVPYIESQSPILDNYTLFVSELRRMFDDPDRERNASRKIAKFTTTAVSSLAEFESQFFDFCFMM